MTVGQLRALLLPYPDDAKVVMVFDCKMGSDEIGSVRLSRDSNLPREHEVIRRGDVVCILADDDSEWD